MRRHLLTIAAFLILAAAALADPAPARAAWVWPVDGDVITPYRNGTDPYASGQHRGIDIGARAGTAVVAAAGGEVRFAGTAGSSGLTISVRTSDGYDTSYLHLSSLAVSAGRRVSAGERIGAVGTTGTRSAAAPHLHFGVREAGTRHDYRDPLAFLPTPPATRAPEPPPATPGPVPEPAVRAPVLEPAPPAALPVPAPRHQPAPRRAPRPQPAPRRAPRHQPAPRGAPAPRRAPHPAPARRAPQRVGAPRAAPRSIPSPLGSQLPDRHERAPAGAPGTLRSAPAAEASTSAVDAEPTRGGPDIGWVLACAGLLLAAGILTLTNDGRPASPDRRERLARMLPLSIRR